MATIIGSSLLSLIIIQAYFTNEMNALREARAVSKGVGNLLQSEIRMVEVSCTVVTLRDSVPKTYNLTVPIFFKNRN